MKPVQWKYIFYRLILDANQQLTLLYSTVLSDTEDTVWGKGETVKAPLPVLLAQFLPVLALTEDDDWVSQPHSITLPVSLVPTSPLPISCSAELFVCTNLPPSTHCAKLMYQPQHIDHANVQGICVLLTPERS